MILSLQKVFIAWVCFSFMKLFNVCKQRSEKMKQICISTVCTVCCQMYKYQRFYRILLRTCCLLSLLATIREMVAVLGHFLLHFNKCFSFLSTITPISASFLRMFPCSSVWLPFLYAVTHILKNRTWAKRYFVHCGSQFVYFYATVLGCVQPDLGTFSHSLTHFVLLQ
jgi:hypothetical protein